MIKAAFFPGCLIPIKYPHMELAVRNTLPGVGVEIVDLPGFTCCPDPIYFQAGDKLDWLTMAARNLCIAEEAGTDIFTICSGCTSTLCEANHELQADEILKGKKTWRDKVPFLKGFLRKSARQLFNSQNCSIMPCETL